MFITSWTLVRLRFQMYLPSLRGAHFWTASVSACLCLCNPSSCLNSLSSYQSQQVSTQPCTDSARFPTGRLSSRSWLAWLTRTHLARRPWRRGKRPVWISSGSCWLGLTRIWVRRAHPNSLQFCQSVTNRGLRFDPVWHGFLSSFCLLYSVKLSWFGFVWLHALAFLTPSVSCASAQVIPPSVCANYMGGQTPLTANVNDSPLFERKNII